MNNDAENEYKNGIVFLLTFIVLVGMPIRELQAQQVTVLQGGTLIDGMGAAPQADTNIVIKGNRIQSIGSGRIPRGATTAPSGR